uniref:Plasmid stability protein n=1 Tax=Candidatus Kentrum sp. FM TaxID=2126340 RepID=A0A450W251_9GAMM|nr:MAG: Plasmid stability protein [Candidatus Kentron sp. FM]VFJ57557.1 MAG: Plasmid stability protein [Candidatus Kentron sp. FM]VFK11099.1 MAG: Plasmid stability protein [Candidatus Kentron sp. FM]
MTELVVRNIDDRVVSALKVQAELHGISAEAEHRRILRDALLTPRRRPFREVTVSMPDVGEDADFERVRDNGRGDVFA